MHLTILILWFKLTAQWCGAHSTSSQQRPHPNHWGTSFSAEPTSRESLRAADKVHTAPLPGCLEPQVPVLGVQHLNPVQHDDKHLGEHLQEYQLQGGRHSENSQQYLPCLVIRKMCAAGERAERARKTEEETQKRI